MTEEAIEKSGGAYFSPLSETDRTTFSGGTSGQASQFPVRASRLMLTLLAGLSMLCGVLAFVVLWGYNLSFQTRLSEDKAFIQFITSRKFLLAAMILGAAHLFFMGYKGWLNPSGWHGGLPPISLVATLFFVTGYIVNLIGRK